MIKLIPFDMFHVARYLACFFLLGLLICSCSSVEDDEPLVCDTEALFFMEDVEGVMQYLPCYDAWAILISDSEMFDYPIMGASLEIPQEYRQKDMKVTFDACFYTFDLPLLLADPAPWPELYVIKNFGVSEK